MDNMTNDTQYGALTIGDIAKELKLSTTTISRSISGKGRINEQTRQRVLAYIQEHDYKPNALAKGLAQSKTFNIGVMLPTDAGQSQVPFFHECLNGICEVAAGYDYDVVVTTLDSSNLASLKRIVVNHKVDGVILTRTYVDDMALRYLKESKLPFVAIGSTNEPDVWQVDCDHAAGCEKLTSLIQLLGSKKIALLVGSMEHVVNISRKEGFERAFENASDAVPMVITQLQTREQIYRGVESALEQKADCIIGADDYICGAILQKLREEHVRVPEDIRVASFYNNWILEESVPAVTSLSIDVKGLGAAAGQCLFDLLNKREVEKRTLVGYEILLRASTPN